LYLLSIEVVWAEFATETCLKIAVSVKQKADTDTISAKWILLLRWIASSNDSNVRNARRLDGGNVFDFSRVRRVS
jgi:hypothetical protein